MYSIILYMETRFEKVLINELYIYLDILKNFLSVIP